MLKTIAIIVAVAGSITSSAVSAQSLLKDAKTCTQAKAICNNYCLSTYRMGNGSYRCSEECLKGQSECMKSGCFKTALTADCGIAKR